MMSWMKALNYINKDYKKIVSIMESCTATPVEFRYKHGAGKY